MQVKYLQIKGGIKIRNLNLKKLNQLRVENGKKLKDLAEILNIDTTTYFKKEIGDRKFTLEEAMILSSYYQVTIEELFFEN